MWACPASARPATWPTGAAALMPLTSIFASPTCPAPSATTAICFRRWARDILKMQPPSEKREATKQRVLSALRCPLLLFAAVGDLCQLVAHLPQFGVEGIF